jgi:hypothetical protein
MAVTNGYIFRDDASASALLDRYFELTAAPLRLYVSIDYWHEGSWRDTRSGALEAALGWRDAQQERPSLTLGISSLWCADSERNIQPHEFERYVEAGVGLQYLPLSPLVSPATLDSLAPKLCPSGTDKSNLGSYGEVLRARMGLSEEEWSALENTELLGPCQAVDMLTLDLDRNWWLCNDRAGRGMRVASAAGLSKDGIADCLARNPLVQLFRRRGFAQALLDCEAGAGPVDADTTRALLGRPHPYGVSGRAACGLCRALPAECFA